MDRTLGNIAPIISRLRGQLIVSCQAKEGEPMRDPGIMAAVALTVVQAGAAAVRVNTPEHIRVVRNVVDVPIIGLYKKEYPDAEVYITPTLDEARAIVDAGCDILAVEATARSRPRGESLATFIQALRVAFTLPIMADISTLEEGIAAADLGVDLVATTMSGYTPYSRQTDEPDLDLVEALARAVSIPVIAEGRINTPADARRALDRGAFAVVVGSMITRPGHITEYFLRGMRDAAPPDAGR